MARRSIGTLRGVPPGASSPPARTAGHAAGDRTGKGERVSDSDRPQSLGLMGGTGPQGRGLAARWARAGHTVLVGSRERDKAQDAVDKIREILAGGDGGDRVEAATNREAVERAEVVVVTIPYQAQSAALPDLREAIGTKIVVNVVNPMKFDELGPKAVPVEAGSAAEECQQLLPDARVVSAFNAVPARRLTDIAGPVDCDVLVCGDDEDAKQEVLRLAERLPGVFGVDCGPLRNSQYIEHLTPLLLSINRRYKIHSAIRIDGLDRDR